MIASLPMYWRAETAAFWQAFWTQVQIAARDAGVDLPDITPPATLPRNWEAHWLDPQLALSMTCGLPFRTTLKDKVAYVGTLDFGLGGPAAHYWSQVILHPDVDAQSPEGLALAFNANDSQSGWAAAQGAAPFEHPRRFKGLVRTGSHAASLAAVAQGAADIAYIDAVTWRLLRAFDPASQQVRAMGQTLPTPGLPLIAARDAPFAKLRTALTHATRQFAHKAGAGPLTPMSFHALDPEAYFAVPVPKPPSEALTKTA